ncbi:hypothetical protein AAHB37_12470 [Glutamicibacter halophytocola]
MSKHLPVTPDEIAEAAIGASKGRSCNSPYACTRSQRRASVPGPETL